MQTDRTSPSIHNPAAPDRPFSMTQASGRRPLRVGIVGAGKMGVNHARAIAQCVVPAEVVATADASAAALRALGAVAPSARHFGSLGELLAGERVDLVHICTPASSHGSLAGEAIEAGCHVYVEKPFAQSITEAEKILSIAEKRGLKVAAGHQLLYEAPTRIAMRMLPSLGRLAHIESYFSFRTVRRSPGGRVPLASDAQLLDILPHPVYLLLQFLDLGASGRPELLALDIGETGTVHALVRQGPLTASLVVTLEGRPVESYMRLVGTNGSVFADYVRGTVQRNIGPGTSGIDKVLAPYRTAGQLLWGTTSALSERVRNRRKSYPGLVELFDCFYESINGRTASPISAQNIIETTRVWEQVALAMRSRKPAVVSNPASLQHGVLLTGGTGLLGGAVARHLAACGRAVRVISRREPASWERVPNVEYVIADLARPLEPTLLAGIDSVIHAAAETAGGWEEHQRNSIDATENVIRAAAAAGVKRLIHVSSLAVLARPKGRTAVTDDTALEQQSRAYGPYVWGKLESERLARRLGEELQLGVKIARPGPLVDACNFEPPGRLGRRIGNFFVAVGSPGDRLAMTDVAFAARTLVWMLDHFDSAPATLNLLDAELPTKREGVLRLRQRNPDVTVMWLPTVLLVALSWVASIAQKLIRPGKPALNVAKAFASPCYDTSCVRSLVASMSSAEPSRPSRDRIEIAKTIPLTREYAWRAHRSAADRGSRSRSDMVCRVMNVAIASLALIVLSPVIVLFAALVKLTSPGPIFYSQARVGIDRRRRLDQNVYDRRARDLGGLPFMIYKFRTMYVGAEGPNGAVWATQADERVTRIGRFMRTFRIDELPQLINVIRGDMNIVGPRPERPSIFSRLRVDIEEYPLRQRAKPGITGWAQVNQSYDTSLDDVRKKVRYDLEYLERQGVREDLKIIARTVPVMIFRKGGW
jgi:lipopolysaccharide/colanic/teichoic acid biosynthesis glycosyltransferase/predicted dehydrogenase/nucleoside-diphosphate-sugar epimerase